MGHESAGGTGPRQPSQAEGDRETVEQDLGERPDRATQGGDTPEARGPEDYPSQAEGERDKQGV